MTKRINAMGALTRDGQVLLGLRAPHKKVAPNCWDFIGGGVKSGETLEEALRRELMEEIAVSARDVEPLAVFSHADGLDHVFHVRVWDGAPRLANDEHVALSWYSAADIATLQGLADEGYRAVIADLLR